MRVVAAALLARPAITLYFTFSRGAIWVLPVGLVLYVRWPGRAGCSPRVPAALPGRGRRRVAYGADDCWPRRLRHRRGRARRPAASRWWWSGARGRGARCGAPRCRSTRGSERCRLPASARCAAGWPSAVLIVVVVGGLAVHAPRRIADASATFSQANT